jgi:hypothetical protein
MDRHVYFATALVDHELSVGGVAALASVYEKTFAQLAPVIGARGVRGIFARAVEVVSRQHPELASFVLGEEPHGVASELAPCFANESRDDARVAAVALYSAFFDLIVSFVGFELTVRLLDGAWPDLALNAAIPREPPPR